MLQQFALRFNLLAAQVVSVACCNTWCETSTMHLFITDGLAASVAVERVMR